MFPAKAHRAAAAILIAGAILHAAAPAAEADGPVPPPQIEAMKRAYLDCERAALSGAIDRGGILFCSALYERLKAEAFGGSFAALKRWFDLQSTGAAGAGV